MNEIVSCQVHRYSVDAKSWTRLPDMIEQRQGHGSINVGDIIAVVGGRKASLISSTMEILDLNSLNAGWSLIQPPHSLNPTPNDYIGRTFPLLIPRNEQKILIVGGQSKRGLQQDGFEVDLQGKTFQKVMQTEHRFYNERQVAAEIEPGKFIALVTNQVEKTRHCAMVLVNEVEQRVRQLDYLFESI